MDARDTTLRTGDFKVHVAEVIFVPEDIGEQRVFFLAFAYQADADTRDRVGDRHASSHQAERGAAYGSHRGRAVRFEDIGDDSDRVRELFWIRRDRFDTAFGECTVTNLATSRATNGTAFAHGERREVVVQHELLRVFVLQSVDTLLVFGRTQCDRDQRLGFTALEDGRAVDTWQHIDMAFNVTQRLAVTAIGADTFQNAVTDDALFQVVPDGRKAVAGDGVFGLRVRDDFAPHAFFQSTYGFRTCLLARGRFGGLELVVVAAFEAVEQPIVCGRNEFDFFRLNFFCQFLLQGADLFDRGVCEFDRFCHVRFRHLAGEAFDHRDFFRRAGDDQVEIALFQLIDRWEGDKLAVDPTDAHGSNRAEERQRRNQATDRSSVHGENVAIRLLVTGHHKVLNLNFVIESFGEQGADRTVDQAGGQSFFRRGPTFTLQKATGELARCCGPFAIVAHQRKEVDAFTGGARRHRRQHDGFTELYQNTCRCLLAQLSRFEGQCGVSNLLLDSYLHVTYLSVTFEFLIGRSNVGDAPGGCQGKAFRSATTRNRGCLT